MDNLIEQAKKDIVHILNTYSGWWKNFECGKVSSGLHHDLIEFVNLRMETVDSCNILLDNERVADALGLNRSLLENYLLFILMCRGKKYFRLRKLKRSEKMQHILEEETKRVGTNSLLAVKPHPTLHRYLIYIFEGLKSSSDEDMFIPYHYFLSKEFEPESMRLNEEDYFTYYDATDEVKAVDLKHQQEQTFLYRHYLSYDALLNCLSINDIADEPALRRIDAHYTFLGRFLHPTSDAARNLRTKNNYHSARTTIGTEYPYERSAVLLAYSYTIHNAIGLLEELANVLDNAPENFKNSGSTEIHKIIDAMKQKYSYFWYVFNEPSDYAKFNYAVNCLSDEDFALADKNFRKIDPSLVTFDKNIFGSFTDTMGGWSNRRVGSYHPPYDTKDS